MPYGPTGSGAANLPAWFLPGLTKAQAAGLRWRTTT